MSVFFERMEMIQNGQNQITQWKAKAEELRTKAETLKDEIKNEYEQQIQSIEAKIRESQRKLEELKKINNGDWDSAEEDISQTWGRVKTHVEEQINALAHKI